MWNMNEWMNQWMNELSTACFNIIQHNSKFIYSYNLIFIKWLYLKLLLSSLLLLRIRQSSMQIIQGLCIDTHCIITIQWSEHEYESENINWTHS